MTEKAFSVDAIRSRKVSISSLVRLMRMLWTVASLRTRQVGIAEMIGGGVIATCVKIDWGVAAVYI